MKSPLNRIEVHGAGAGEFSQADIDQRAEELARSDGRTEANEIDLAQARMELGAGSERQSREDEVAEEDRVEAGIPVGSLGTQGDRFELDDEQALAERLVEEGIEEAEHDSRLRSNDP